MSTDSICQRMGDNVEKLRVIIQRMDARAHDSLRIVYGLLSNASSVEIEKLSQKVNLPSDRITDLIEQGKKLVEIPPRHLNYSLAQCGGPRPGAAALGGKLQMGPRED